jgi:small subunit ribosomal protein S6
MRRYETIIILDPDISAEERAPVVDRVKDTIAQREGFLVLVDEWGARKLAYEIKNKPRGFYTRFDYCGSGAIVDEIERFCRIDDRVLKYLTVLLDEQADVEKIKEETAKASAEKQASETEKPVSGGEAEPETTAQTEEALQAETAEPEAGKEE